MRAAVMRDRRLVVADLPVPEPGPGEVLVKTLACGICDRSPLLSRDSTEVFSSMSSTESWR